MLVGMDEVDYLVVVLTISVVGRARQNVRIGLVAIEQFAEIVEVGRRGEEFRQLGLQI